MILDDPRGLAGSPIFLVGASYAGLGGKGDPWGAGLREKGCYRGLEEKHSFSAGLETAVPLTRISMLKTASDA
jgi:hypothetical protein